MLNIKRIVALMSVMILVLGSTLSANAVTTLGVNYIKQEKTQWCWAASSQMTGKYVYPSATATQTQIVTHVKGSNINEPATVDETVNATMFVTNDTINFSYAYNPFSFATVKNYINAGLPIQPLVHKTYSDGAQSGHYYVIYGYNETSAGNYLYIVDPWDGYGKYVSYHAFLNGTWSDDRPWISSVA